MIDAEGSRLLADVFNTLTEEQKNIMPEDVAERIERFMTANGFRMVFSRWFLQCEQEVKQDPVAKVDANDECYWADILPDRSVKVGQLLYAFPPDAQAEIERRDARIKELEERLNEAVGGFKRDLVKQLQDCRRSKERQAAEINEQARLLGISAEKELTLRAENNRLKAENKLYAAEMSAAKENGFYSAQELFMAYQNAEEELAEAKKDAERWKYARRKMCFTGNGDGTCMMQGINLPAAIPGWPDPGKVAEFCDAAIDAAMKGK